MIKILQDINNTGIISYDDLKYHYNYIIKVELDETFVEGWSVILSDGKSTGEDIQTSFVIKKYNLEDGYMLIGRTIGVESSYSVTVRVENTNGVIVKQAETKSIQISGIPNVIDYRLNTVKVGVNNDDNTKIDFIKGLLDFEYPIRGSFVVNYSITPSNGSVITGSVNLKASKERFSSYILTIDNLDLPNPNTTNETITLAITSIEYGINTSSNNSQIIIDDSFTIIQDEFLINTSLSVNFDNYTSSDKYFVKTDSKIFDNVRSAEIVQNNSQNIHLRLKVDDLYNSSIKVGDKLGLYILRDGLGWTGDNDNSDKSYELISKGIDKNITNTGLGNKTNNDYYFVCTFNITSLTEYVDVIIPADSIIDVRNKCGTLFNFSVVNFTYENSIDKNRFIDDGYFYHTDYFMTQYKPNISLVYPTTGNLRTKSNLVFTLQADRKHYIDTYYILKVKTYSNDSISEKVLFKDTLNNSLNYNTIGYGSDSAIQSIASGLYNVYVVKISSGYQYVDFEINGLKSEEVYLDVSKPYNRYSEALYSLRSSENYASVYNTFMIRIGNVKSISEYQPGKFGVSRSLNDGAVIILDGLDTHEIGSSFSFAADKNSQVFIQSRKDIDNNFYLQCTDNIFFNNGCLTLNQYESVRIRKISSTQYLVTDYSASDLSVISSLKDVDITGVVNGDFLKWNGTKWVPGNVIIPEQHSALSSLTDVSITSPINGQIVKYIDGQWVNQNDIDDLQEIIIW